MASVTFDFARVVTPFSVTVSTVPSASATYSVPSMVTLPPAFGIVTVSTPSSLSTLMTIPVSFALVFAIVLPLNPTILLPTDILPMLSALYVSLTL